GRRLETLTDPAVFFTQVRVPAAPTLQNVSDRLPDWLSQADSADRFAYHRHLQDMAQVLQQNQGQSFNQGIEDLYSFSRTTLRKQMQTDHGDCDPDEVVLDFIVSAGYPGGAGIVEHVRLSLTELAVKNLSGKPSGTLKILAKGAQALPVWLTEDYLLGTTGLIQRVDIGTAYPQKIKDTLLSDTADARRREALFTRELKVKLPMQALEYKMRRQHGVSIAGYRYVKALMGETPLDRYVDGQEIVLRPLALCRKAGATPDEVCNTFIIEPRDTRIGPHLLYQPLYADTLHEFPTRQALLDALASPGALQDSVLIWLSDTARPIDDHGGIRKPHLIR
ncbi:dermonecrotic toxin domain-containing protein, partial [Pseudomonas aeruginosa]|uniref:dermonecrotic toxin domain-containing protein n=1 Tax=Pseudomonas aeruginosa TaxID=287 RepID=UPI00356B7029